MKTKNLFGEIARLTLIAAIVIGVMYYFQGKQENYIADYFKDRDFKTDTLVIREEYKLPQTRVEHVLQPYYVYQYEPFDTNRLKNIIVEYMGNVIKIIDSAKGTEVKINPDYLKLYPENPKLIYGSFNRDSIRLDLLNIQGSIFSEIYPVDFNRYTYTFTDGKMGVSKYELGPLAKKKVAHNFMVGPAYNLVESSPMVSGAYQVNYKRLQLRAQTDFSFRRPSYLHSGLYLYYDLVKAK